MTTASIKHHLSILHNAMAIFFFLAAKYVSGNKAKRIAHAARHAVQKEGTGAQVLLDLAKRAEREGWEGPSDLAQNHDNYAAEAAEEDLKRIHDYYR